MCIRDRYKDKDSVLAAFERGELDCVNSDKLTVDVYAMKENVQAWEYLSLIHI